MHSFTYIVEDQPRQFSFSDEIFQEVSGIWKNFKQDIISRNRFFSGNDVVSILSQLNYMPVLPEGTHLTYYRARIGDYLHTTDSDMMAPPSGKASSGRCNPTGISYLYLASSKDTAIQEIKPQIGDTVTIATFDVDVSMMFSFNVYLWEHRGITASDEKAKCLLFLIIEDLSSAVTQSNSLDYLPLQFIAEYIKSLGYHSFAYSSVYGTGMNLTMFDWSSKVKITSKEKVLISNTKIEYR